MAFPLTTPVVEDVTLDHDEDHTDLHAFLNPLYFSRSRMFLLNDAAYGGSPSTAGTTGNNIFAAMPSTGGVIVVPDSTWTIDTPIIPTKSNVRIMGLGPNSKLVSNGVDIFDMDSAGADIQQLEIDHLTLDATNGHVFAGARFLRSHFHHLEIFARSSGKSVFSAPAVLIMAHNRFDHIYYHVFGATRSVPAWELTSTGSDLILGNEFEHVVGVNEDGDGTQYQFKVVCSNANASNRDNRWRDMAFKNARGGSIRVESASGTVIERAVTYDTPAATILLPSFYIGKQSGNSSPSRSTTFRSVGRVGDGPNTGIQDIQLESTCEQTTIEAPFARGSTVNLRVDFGGSAGAALINPPSLLTLIGVTGAESGLIAAPYVVRKTSNETVTSSTALQNDNELLAAVLANTLYRVDMFVIYDGATTGDIKLGFTAPAGATFDWTATAFDPAIGAGALIGSVKLSHSTIASAEPAGAVGTGAGNRSVARIAGWLLVAGTAGTFQFQWAQNASDATATTVLAGSVLEITRK